MKTCLVPIPIPFYSQRYGTDFEAAGFRSKAEAEYWQDRACGMACLRMVLDGFRRTDGKVDVPPLGVLVYEGVAAGVYCDRGWVHQGLADLATRYGVHAEAKRKATVQNIIAELKRGRPCIASVTVRFKTVRVSTDGTILPAGGHLCVVLGWTEQEHRVTSAVVNHPSKCAKYDWERKSIQIDDFEKAFSGSFIAFGPRRNFGELSSSPL